MGGWRPATRCTPADRVCRCLATPSRTLRALAVRPTLDAPPTHLFLSLSARPRFQPQFAAPPLPRSDFHLPCRQQPCQVHTQVRRTGWFPSYLRCHPPTCRWYSYLLLVPPGPSAVPKTVRRELDRYWQCAATDGSSTGGYSLTQAGFPHQRAFHRQVFQFQPHRQQAPQPQRHT
jgi:hypothetical protein